MNKRKIVITVVVVCLIAAAGLFAVKWQYESKVRGDIENFLANLPAPLTAKAGNIDVSFFDKSVAISDLKGSYTISLQKDGKEEATPVDFAVARILASGINQDAFKAGAGTAKLADSLAVDNVTVTSPIVQASIENYIIEDISADVQQVVDAWAKAFPAMMAATLPGNVPSDEEMRALMADYARIFKAYETARVGRMAFTNYKYSLDVDGQKIAVRLASGEAKDYSIRKIGPVVLNTTDVALDGAPFMTVDTISSEEIILPSFVKFLEIIARDGGSSSLLPQLQEALAGQDFSIKNLRLRNLSVQHPQEKDTLLLTLADSAFSYAAQKAHTMDLTFDKLNTDKKVLLKNSRLPAEVLADLPDTVSLDGVLQTVITPKGSDTFDVDIKKNLVKGQGMGEFSLSMAAENTSPMPLLMGMPSNATLKNFDLAVTDEGLSNVIFAINGYYEGNSPEQARAGEVDSLRQELAAESSPVGKMLLEGVINFLEKSGNTIRVVMAPSSPATMAALMQAYMSGSPEAIGLSVTVTPGK